MSGVHGFPPELFTFFEGLEKDNSKAYYYYLRLQASGLMTGCGAMVMAPDQSNVCVRRSTTTPAAADSRN